jgi:hypothetical protein
MAAAANELIACTRRVALKALPHTGRFKAAPPSVAARAFLCKTARDCRRLRRWTGLVRMSDCGRGRLWGNGAAHEACGSPMSEKPGNLTRHTALAAQKVSNSQRPRRLLYSALPEQISALRKSVGGQNTQGAKEVPVSGRRWSSSTTSMVTRADDEVVIVMRAIGYQQGSSTWTGR